MQRNEIRMMVMTSLFTVLIIIGGYISFPMPLSPVPLVLSDFFVLLTGLFLGAGWGAAAIMLFLFLGALGFPVFAGGKAGLAVFFGPTGGYLIGFLVCVIIDGLIAGKGKTLFWKDVAALIAGTVIIYACGIPWLKYMVKLSWAQAFAVGLLPFVAGAVVKIIAASIAVKAIRPIYQSFRDGN